MKIHVTRAQFGDSLDFNIDTDTRTLSGADAVRVRATADAWPGHGYLYGTQPVEAPDPIGSMRDMAVMLAASDWDLPDELTGLLPLAEDIPEGAVA